MIKTQRPLQKKNFRKIKIRKEDGNFFNSQNLTESNSTLEYSKATTTPTITHNTAITEITITQQPAELDTTEPVPEDFSIQTEASVSTTAEALPFLTTLSNNIESTVIQAGKQSLQKKQPEKLFYFINTKAHINLENIYDTSNQTKDRFRKNTLALMMEIISI